MIQFKQKVILVLQVMKSSRSDIIWEQNTISVLKSEKHTLQILDL